MGLALRYFRGTFDFLFPCTNLLLTILIFVFFRRNNCSQMALTFSRYVDFLSKHPLCFLREFPRLHNKPALCPIHKVTKLLTFLTQLLIIIIIIIITTTITMMMMMTMMMMIIIVIKVQGAHVAIFRPWETQTPRACNQILPTV